MNDLKLREFGAWAEKRITLKHNWFDRLADIVRIMPDGANIPTVLSHWEEDYLSLVEWVKGANDAFSPKQVFDLDAFRAWPERFRERHGQRLHARHLAAAPHVKRITDQCLRLLKSVDEELRPLLEPGGPAITPAGREKIAGLLNSIALLLRELPEHVTWPEPATDDLPPVLVIDDLLGRVTLQSRDRPAVTEQALSELGELRRAFCHRFRLLDAESPERTERVTHPIGRAFFCAGQRYDPAEGFVNDLDLVRRHVQSRAGEWVLVIADVLFNTGRPEPNGRGDGETRFGIEEVVPWLRRHAPELPVVALTTESSHDLIMRAQELGIEYLHRTESEHSDLLVLITRGGRATPAHLRRALNVPEDFVAEDPRSIEVLLDAWTAANDPAGKTVLITGEPGAGKERLADFIHKMSPRADKPIMFVNCARYSKELAETELFGYYASSFTSAAPTDTPGAFHAANGGTLVLDEFGDLDRDVQAKLLRTLEPKRACDREIEPRGNRGKNSRLAVEVDVRVICCTNQPLHMVRPDLLTRVAKIIEIPPLRERPGDIVPLARFFLKHPKRVGKPGVSLDESACAFLSQVELLGNARTLEQILDAASTGKGGRNIITRADLETAYERLRRSLSAELGAARPSEPAGPRRDDSPSAARPTDGGGLAQAVMRILSATHEGRDWKDMSRAELQSLDGSLDGHVWEVIALLCEWAIFASQDIPSTAKYITGQQMLQRAPQDFLRRLLKLDYRIFKQVAASPHLGNNARLREIIAEVGDEWARRPRSS
jgi:DNA-binding NtrC family response regulator